MLKQIKRKAARGTLGVFAVTLFRKGAISFLTFLLAGLLGAVGYGTYAFVMSFTNILVVVCIAGFSGLLAREVAKNETTEELPYLHGLLRFATVFVICGSLFVVAVAIAGVLLFESWLEPGMVLPLILGLLALPVLTLMKVTQSILRGLHRVVIALVPEFIVRPSLIAIALSIMFLTVQSVSAELAVAISGLASLVALIVGLFFLHNNFPRHIVSVAPEYRVKTWTRSAYTIFYIQIFQVLNSDAAVVMLGLYKGAAGSGTFKLAATLATLTTLLLTVIKVPLGPMVSEMLARDAKQELQKLITTTTRAGFLFGLLLVGVSVLFGKEILLLFGAGYDAGYRVLVILSLCQLINIAMGSATIILIMSGHEAEAVKGVSISTALNLGLNALLIGPFGINGAAVAVGVSLICWNFLLMRTVARALTLDTSIFGPPINRTAKGR